MARSGSSSYNIRFGGRGREQRLADVIVGLRPDVVVLQEATDHAIVDRLGEATGLHVVRHPGYSVAALSRVPFRMAGWYRPPVGRSFLVLEPEGLGIRLIGVHLRAGLHSRGEGFRLREVAGLLDVAAAGGSSVAIIGDFNAVAPGDGPLVRRMPLWLRLILRFDGGIRTTPSARSSRPVSWTSSDACTPPHPASRCRRSSRASDSTTSSPPERHRAHRGVRPGRFGRGPSTRLGSPATRDRLRCLIWSGTSGRVRRRRRTAFPEVRHHRGVSTSKVASMRDAIADLVRDGDTVAIEGFTHLICFAAGHEIIRQGRRDLTLARMTPDVIYDQMVAAGVARKLVFSWLGNPGVGGLHAIRRVTEGDSASLELEEYSHFGMVGRYTAGAMNLPFFPLRSYFETDMPVANPRIREIESPYGDGMVYAVPPLKPDVTIIHAQRAVGIGRHPDLGPPRLPEGGGIRGGAGHRRGRGARRRGRHPGRPESDHRARGSSWTPSSSSRGAPIPRTSRAPMTATTASIGTGMGSAATAEAADAWLREWVHGVDDRAGYLTKLGDDRRAELSPGRRRLARSTTGRIGERGSGSDGRCPDDPRRRTVPVRDRWRPGPDQGKRRRDDGRRARAVPAWSPAGHG